MKVKFLLVYMLLTIMALMPLHGQTYSQTDTAALRTINRRCSVSSLNWNTSDPGQWQGITWNNENPKRVTEIVLGSSQITTTGIELSKLEKLEVLQCGNNHIEYLVSYLDIKGKDCKTIIIPSVGT